MSEMGLEHASAEPLPIDTASMGDSSSAADMGDLPHVERTLSKAYDVSLEKSERRDEQRREIARSARGQFSKRVNAVAAQPADRLSAQRAEHREENTGDAIAPPQPTARQAPWPKEYWDDFNKLDPRTQELVIQRERETHNKFSTVGKCCEGERVVPSSWRALRKSHSRACRQIRCFCILRRQMKLLKTPKPGRWLSAILQLVRN